MDCYSECDERYQRYSLDGYKFQDDLSGVGDYVDGSFKMAGKPFPLLIMKTRFSPILLEKLI